MEGENPMVMEEKKGVSSFTYLIGGFAVGAVCGLLLAPKKGSELREDIGNWGRETKERGRELYSRARRYIPHRDRRQSEAGEKGYVRESEKVGQAES